MPRLRTFAALLLALLSAVSLPLTVRAQNTGNLERGGFGFAETRSMVLLK